MSKHEICLTLFLHDFILFHLVLVSLHFLFQFDDIIHVQACSKKYLFNNWIWQANLLHFRRYLLLRRVVGRGLLLLLVVDVLRVKHWESIFHEQIIYLLLNLNFIFLFLLFKLFHIVNFKILVYYNFRFINIKLFDIAFLFLFIFIYFHLISIYIILLTFLSFAQKYLNIFFWILFFFLILDRYNFFIIIWTFLNFKICIFICIFN